MRQYPYFFPNLIAYEALKFERSFKSEYLNFLELFRANALIEYFFNPFVQVQNPIPHMEQRHKAFIISLRIYLDIISLFNNMTEDALPPRARSTLIRSIMNQNINTAAILDFESLEGLASAINYYGNDHIYWELDDRSEEERTKTFDMNLPKLSEPIRKAFDRVKDEFPEISTNNQRVFQRALTQSFGHLITMIRPSDQKIIREMIGGHSVKNIDLARKYLQLAFNKIDQGEFTDLDLRRLQHILFYIPGLENPEKVFELDKLYKDKTMIRMKIEEEVAVLAPAAITLGTPSQDVIIPGVFTKYVLNNVLRNDIGEIRNGNLRFETLFELLLILEEEPWISSRIGYEEVYNYLMSLSLLDTSLKEKKQLADFFWMAGKVDKNDYWVDKIFEHIDKIPNQENILLLSSWLRNGSGCFLKNEEKALQVEEWALSIWWLKIMRGELQYNWPI